MNHSDVGRHLADYLEGELPIEERALFDAHLDDCNECAQELEEMLQTIRLLRKLPEPEIPPMITANVMRRVRAGETRTGWIERVTRVVGGILEPGFVLPASAIAAGALVIAVVQGVGGLPGSDLVDELPIFGGAEATVSSMAPPIGSSGSTNVGRPDEAAIAARVERRASRSVVLPSPSDPVVVDSGLRGSGPRIQIEIDSMRLARPMSQGVAPPPGSSGSGFGPQLSAGWAFGGSSLAPRSRAAAMENGTLVAAERSSPMESSLSSEAWSPLNRTGDRSAAGDAQVGADPRDAWLALGFDDPSEFARYIAAQNLAEQELWAARLSDRAARRGLLGEFLQKLRDSGDPTAAWVADDFEAQARRGGVASSEPESPDLP